MPMADRLQHSMGLMMRIGIRKLPLLTQRKVAALTLEAFPTSTIS